MKLRCIRAVKWSWVYKLTMEWMRANSPGSLLLAPAVFPVIFVLNFYQQYLIEKLLAILKTLTDTLAKNKLLESQIVGMTEENAVLAANRLLEKS